MCNKETYVKEKLDRLDNLAIWSADDIKCCVEGIMQYMKTHDWEYIDHKMEMLDRLYNQLCKRINDVKDYEIIRYRSKRVGDVK